MQSQQSFSNNFSFELFPPKTDKGMENLKNTVSELNTKNPKFFSCTYGAGGSTQERTFSTVDWLRQQGIDTAPHLSCIGSDKTEILEILEHYKSEGVKRLVALRGDLPSGAGAGGLGDLRYANQLVELIKTEYGDHFFIEVAAYPEMHPQADNFNADVDNFMRKVNAGADSAITQYFYNVDAYLHFIDVCESKGLDIPVVPGIMPITNFSSLSRFSDACGAELPRWLRKQMEAYGDDVDSIRALGHETVLKLCQRLLDAGAPGLHFYTMNQSAATLKLWDDLGI